MTETATPAFDELLLEWLQCARVGRTDKQSLLLEALLDTTHPSSPSTTRTALTVLEAVSASPTDVQHLRQHAEALTVLAEEAPVRASLSADCAMELHLGETRQIFVGPRAADDIAAELCAQQQSLHATLARAATHPSALRPSAHGVTCLRQVSAPQSWLVDPSASLASEPAVSHSASTSSRVLEPFETGPLRVGTLVTYYDDAERRRVVFSVHTIFTFAVDGHCVERIVRTLQTRDGSSAVEALTGVHFGYLLEKSMRSSCV